MAKDYFSGHSKIYAAFRPTYPEELYQFVNSHVHNFSRAWDCATGNGQVAQVLSQHFDDVQATDISQSQLDNAVKAGNIHYSVCPAEQTSFADSSFDLITVAQALHWFDHEKFFEEARRVGKPGAALAVWGYSILTVNKEIDELFYHYYKNIVGRYWDNARKHVEEEYAGIHFPFENCTNKKFFMTVAWTARHFIGYLRSWSATQKFTIENGYDPLIMIEEQLSKIWDQQEIKTVVFPIFVKLVIL